MVVLLVFSRVFARRFSWAFLTLIAHLFRLDSKAKMHPYNCNSQPLDLISGNRLSVGRQLHQTLET